MSAQQQTRAAWRVVDPHGVLYVASVLEPADAAGRGFWHAQMTAGTRRAEKRATTARRAVCLAALELGVEVAEIRGPGERTTAEAAVAAVERITAVACSEMEGT